MSNLGLYRFLWDCGRMGEVEGLFFAEADEVEKAIGSHIYFGEILGKHSEIHGTLDKDDLERLDINGSALEELRKATGNTVSGYNPLNFITDRT